MGISCFMPFPTSTPQLWMQSCHNFLFLGCLLAPKVIKSCHQGFHLHLQFLHKTQKHFFKIFFPDVFLWRRSIYFTKKKSLPSWEGREYLWFLPAGLRAVKSNAMLIFQCFFTWSCCVKHLINHHVLIVLYISGPQAFWHQGPVPWKTIFPQTGWRALVQAVMRATGGWLESSRWSVPRLPSAHLLLWGLVSNGPWTNTALQPRDQGPRLYSVCSILVLLSDTPAFRYHFCYRSQVGELVAQELLTNTKR